MFTGIIEETGILVSSARGPRSCVLNIRARAVLDGTGPGDSIAVNGVCLTAATVSPTGFTADVMPETLARTGLGSMKPGALVNLERAMAADGQFGGHIVSGHIDGTGTISMVKRDGNATWYTVDTSPCILDFIIEKGSIAMDGISLTVASVTDQNFRVSVIPHTASHTNLVHKAVGDTVNLENDCVGKYIEKFIKIPPSAHSTEWADTGNRRTNSRITPELLKQYGF